MKKETSIKMNNKGFSLVELIIVIAIMAVLIGIMAPQFLKYVEKSRNSTDVSNAQAIASALQVYATDTEAATALASGSIVVDSTANMVITGAGAQDALTAANLSNQTKCKSKQSWNSYTIKFTVANGSVTFEYSAAGGSAPNHAAFTKAME